MCSIDMKDYFSAHAEIVRGKWTTEIDGDWN